MTTFPPGQGPFGPRDEPVGEPRPEGGETWSGPAAFGLPGDPYEEPEDRPEGATQPVPAVPGPPPPPPQPTQPTQPTQPLQAPPGTPYPPYGNGRGQVPVRPARPRSAGVLVVAVVLLLVLGVAGVAVAVLRGPDRQPSTALPTATSPFPSSATTPSDVPPTTLPPSFPPSSPSTSSPRSSGPRTTPTPPPVSATRPGWTAVAGRELVAYDVPPGWKALSSGTLTGFETSGGPKQLVIMHNAAAYQDDACPKASSSSRGQAGFVAWKGQSPSTVAREVSRQWATVAGTQDDGTVMPLSSTVESRATVAGGTIPATVATTTLTLQDQPSCAAARIDFTAVSFQVRGQPVIFMLYLDRGVADEVSARDRDAIIASLRPV